MESRKLEDSFNNILYNLNDGDTIEIIKDIAHVGIRILRFKEIDKTVGNCTTHSYTYSFVFDNQQKRLKEICDLIIDKKI